MLHKSATPMKLTEKLLLVTYINLLQSNKKLFILFTTFHNITGDAKNIIELVDN